MASTTHQPKALQRLSETIVQFKESKQELGEHISACEKLKQNIPHNITLPIVEEKGFIFDHHVRGAELNEVTSRIQGHLISLKICSTNCYEALDKICQTLNCIDTKSMGGILFSLKAIEKVHHDELKDRQQIRILAEKNRILAEQNSDAIEVLIKFKNDTEHMTKVLCKNIRNLHNEIRQLKNSFEFFEASIKRLDEDAAKKIKEECVVYTESQKKLENQIGFLHMILKYIGAVLLIHLVLDIIGVC